MKRRESEGHRRPELLLSNTVGELDPGKRDSSRGKSERRDRAEQQARHELGDDHEREHGRIDRDLSERENYVTA